MVYTDNLASNLLRDKAPRIKDQNWYIHLHHLFLQNNKLKKHKKSKLRSLPTNKSRVQVFCKQQSNLRFQAEEALQISILTIWSKNWNMYKESTNTIRDLPSAENDEITSFLPFSTTRETQRRVDLNDIEALPAQWEPVEYL